MKKSRGLRNNNPLNIRRNKTAWKGLAAEQNDSAFFTFIAPCWGYRAAIKTLQNYNRIHGLTTVREWISRWAPPVENDTENYIRFVCKKAEVGENCEPNLHNREVMCRIVAAMSHMENGVPAVMGDIYKGWDLL